MAKRKTVLEAVHATARGLRKAGLMRAQAKREFDLPRLPIAREYTAAQIERNKASCAVFAAYLNTTTSTVQKWGRSEKKQHGPSLKLLRLVDSKGLRARA